jgi:hypothetical protein
MKNKRGSHVGIVLSFVIFVTFIIFLYSALEPAIKTDKNKQILSDYLEIELIKQFSANLTSAIISNDTDPSLFNCLKINSSELEGGGLNAIVKDREDNPVNSKSLTNSLEIDWTNEEFFKIYYSEEFQVGDYTCGSSHKSYNILTLKKGNYIFETKIKKIINYTDENYEKFKKELNIPLGSEFGFSFKNNSKDIIKTKEKDIYTNVYVREIPIQYYNSEAVIMSGSIELKVW